MSLSDKRQTNIDPEFSSIIYLEEDVKEFIKQRIKNIEKIQKRWIGKVCSPEVIGILQGVRHDIEENAGKDLVEELK